MMHYGSQKKRKEDVECTHLLWFGSEMSPEGSCVEDVVPSGQGWGFEEVVGS
jgi:hypothetical protein